jgi:NADP-dependent 3-hydroxy acid dehydrogenase YdfG
MVQHVVVVTGAGAGAGRAIALRFGSNGWRVALIARDAQRLEDAKRDIENAGGEALALPADVADAAAVDRARDRVVERWDGIDAWVNAAMVTVVAPVWRMTAEEYRRVTEVTYLGYVNGTLAALAVMRPRNSGSIVQVGSALAYRGIPLQSAYCAAKFAVRGFTDALRAELRHERSRIRLCMVQLPAMNTPQFDWARNKMAHTYKPVGTIFDPDVAADAVWRAVHDGSRELWVGDSSIEAIAGEMVAPALLERYVAHAAWEGQLEQTPNTRDIDNLYAPVPGSEDARGRFGAHAQARAAMMNPDHARAALAAIALSALGALAAVKLIGRRRPKEL